MKLRNVIKENMIETLESKCKNRRFRKSKRKRHDRERKKIG